ncbi:MAG: NAD-dependent protein deacetylase [Gammaproteobacteria bacterium]|nr:NAD-dependent protein deacetylase [Gammaproteobacteria bacterium]
MSAAERALSDFIGRHRRLFVLTGAGCSTGSGIVDYRDVFGAWKRRQPVTLQAFVGDAAVRARYWGRSLVGWPQMAGARPNAAHRTLAAMEDAGRILRLVTQNVDGLHQAAGSRAVTDLHGRLHAVRCLGCGELTQRQALQRHLLARNPGWNRLLAEPAPDGDADLDGVDFSGFSVPECATCGGLLKPDVVFFGENVPPPRVDAAVAALARADAMLVVGSSLMVWSGFRFVRAAANRGLPIAAVNLGRTRADGFFAAKLVAHCEQALPALAASLIDRSRAI